MKSRPLVALSSAAILAVYTAGYIRTRGAAERFTGPPPPRRATPPVAPKVDGQLAIAAQTPVPAVVPRVAAAPSADASPAAPAVAPAPTLTPPPSDVPGPVGFDAQSVQGLEQGSIDAPPPPPPAVARGQYKDGTYLGWGSCRHGDIQASVVIEDGRVASATIAQCLTRYSCNWIDPLLPQVVTRQSAEVDWVSGATESSDAFYDAVAEALKQAK